MRQPHREKNLILKLGEEIEIDNMKFQIKNFGVVWEEIDFSITIWGRKPNATTFHWSRVLKYQEYIWRPEKAGLRIFTKNGDTYDTLSLDQSEITALNQRIDKGFEKITSCWVAMNTQVNAPIGYFD